MAGACAAAGRQGMAARSGSVSGRGRRHRRQGTMAQASWHDNADGKAGGAGGRMRQRGRQGAVVQVARHDGARDREQQSGRQGVAARVAGCGDGGGGGEQ